MGHDSAGYPDLSRPKAFINSMFCLANPAVESLGENSSFLTFVRRFRDMVYTEKQPIPN